MYPKIIAILLIVTYCITAIKTWSVGYSLYFPYYGYGGGIGYRHPTPPFWG